MDSENITAVNAEIVSKEIDMTAEQIEKLKHVMFLLRNLRCYANVELAYKELCELTENCETK